MSKAVRLPYGLYVGWYTHRLGACWVFLGRTKIQDSCRSLFRFLVVVPYCDPYYESLTLREVYDHVLSPLH